MNISKCDVCKKIIKESDNSYSLSSYKPYLHLDVCLKCGKPLQALLQKKTKAKI